MKAHHHGQGNSQTELGSEAIQKETYKALAIRSAIMLALLYIPYFLRHLLFNVYGIDYLVQIPTSMRLFSKILIFQAAAIMLLFFIIYNRNTLAKIRLPKIDWAKSIALGFLSYIAFCTYYGASIYATTHEAYYGLARYIIILIHAVSLVVFAGAMVLACFGHKYILEIYTRTKPQAYYFALATALVAWLVNWFQGLWHYFSYAITVILAYSFFPFYDTYYWLDGKLPILEVGGFRVSIAEACSGIESMILFAVFSIGIFFLDHHKLRKGRYLVAALIGFAGAYAMNIVRLFLLMLVGIYISPEFAVGLFHTNIGWLLFVVYFFLYYLVAKKFIYAKDNSENEKANDGKNLKTTNVTKKDD